MTSQGGCWQGAGKWMARGEKEMCCYRYQNLLTFA